METKLNPPGIVTEKDLNSNIISCNQTFLDYAGVKSFDDVIGKNDIDLPWSEYAEFYRTHELDAIQGRNYSTIIPFKDYQENQLIFLHTKTQRLDANNKCDGVSCYAVEIINFDLLKLFHLLDSKRTTEKKYFIGKNRKGIELSKRQQEILFFLVRGKTAKMIGKLLDLSYRTVESYIDILKTKFHCNTKSELIEFAIQEGYLQDIPIVDDIYKLILQLQTK